MPNQFSLSIVWREGVNWEHTDPEMPPRLSLASPSVSITLHAQHSEPSMWSAPRYVWLNRSIWSQLIRNLMISGAKSRSVRKSLDSSVFFWEFEPDELLERSISWKSSGVIAVIITNGAGAGAIWLWISEEWLISKVEILEGEYKSMKSCVTGCTRLAVFERSLLKLDCSFYLDET